jgi:hypothetical protein
VARNLCDQGLIDRVCVRVRAGLRVESALNAEGISKQLQHLWRRKAEAGDALYLTLYDQAARARSEFEAEMLDAIRLQATPTQNGDAADWKARAWLLERTMPEAYAPSQTMVLKAQDQAAQDVLEVAREVLPSQWYAALLAALAGVGEADAQGDADEGDEAH